MTSKHGEIMNNFIFKWFLFSAIGWAVSLSYAAEEELLDFKDVHRIMDEMLGQHVDKNKITGEVLQNSMKLYVDEFDPDRIYLLDKEVQEATTLDPKQLAADLKEYDNSDFSDYMKLNQMIQSSIQRAREIRSEFLRNPDIFFQQASQQPKIESEEEEDAKRSFAESVSELRDRIRDEIALFVHKERKRYGDNSVLANREKTLAAFDKYLIHRENQYMFQNDQGAPLPTAEQKNLLVMHILKALSKSLDSHSSFLDSEEAYDMKIRLEKGFHGIGVVLDRKPEGIVISRLIPGGPAERSGLVKVDDRVVKINGENVEDYSLEELINKLRDETKQTVFLVLKRAAEPGSAVSEKTIPVTLKRELISMDEGRVDVAKEPFEDGILGIITLHAFYQGENGVTSEKDMRQAIKELKKAGNLKGIIVDLRENSGGFLNQAVKVAGLFITSGVVVVSKYSNGEEHFYRDMDGKTSFDGPIIVLTSKATASAAEIVAQALQDYGVAVIVGDERTYGKGTIQSQTVTDGGNAAHFKVTVGKYYTVSGKTPQVRGVLADVVVPSHYSREHIGEEYLQRPIEADTIVPSYKDDLVDVEQNLKPWYLRYYMPTLQSKETNLVEIIPILKEKSKQRLAVNREFQVALNETGGRFGYSSSDQEGEAERPDYQLKEAINILKDMIRLEYAQHQGKTAVN